MSGPYLESVHRVFDEHGFSVEVGADLDDLDLVEIRSRDDQGKIVSTINFTRSMFPLVLEAFARHKSDIEAAAGSGACRGGPGRGSGGSEPPAAAPPQVAWGVGGGASPRATSCGDE